MTKRLRQQLRECLVLGPVVMMCIGIACSGQILPLLVAQIVSLDPDHHVIVHVGSHGIDLVLTHDAPTAAVTPQRTRPSIASESPEPAHIIHFSSGMSLANQTAVCAGSAQHQVALHMSLAQPSSVDVFAPRPTLAYSRPPPDRTSNPFDRSTLLLI